MGRFDVGDELRVETVHFPNLPSAEDCDHVAEVVARLGIEVVIVDPLYMGLTGISTTNLTEVGPALRNFKNACTPAAMVLAHHVKKSTDYADAPNLEDLSQAGIAEFAGNYMLLGRLSEYEGDGQHELAIRMGGRDDQFGLYKLDFDEYTWSSRFMDLVAWREMHKAAEQEAKTKAKTALAYDEAKTFIMDMIRSEGGSLSSTVLGRKRQKFQSTLDRLTEEGIITTVQLTTKDGQPKQQFEYHLTESRTDED